MSDPITHEFESSVRARDAHETVLLDLPRTILPKQGSKWLITGVRKPLSSSSYDFNTYAQGVDGTVAVSTAVKQNSDQTFTGHLMMARERLLNLIDSTIHNERIALVVKALIAGDRRDFAPLRTTFQKSGLSHVIAVSGMHLALVMAGVLLLLRKAGLRRGRARIVALAFALLFTFFSGCAPSTMRAFAMASLAAVIPVTHHRICREQLVAIAVLTLILFEPRLLFSISLRLSAAAVMGIIVFTPLAHVWCRALFPLFSQKINDAIALSLTAWISTLPLSLSVFSTISIVAVPTNILAAPWVTLSFITGLLGAMASYLIPQLSWLFLAPAQFFAAGLLTLARAAAVTESNWERLFSFFNTGLLSASFTSITWVMIGLSVLLLLYFWPLPSQLLSSWILMHYPQWLLKEGNDARMRPQKIVSLLAGIALVITLVVLIAPRLISKPLAVSDKSEDGVYFLSVGQGDATYVESGEDSALIDGGPDGLVLRKALDEASVDTIDTLVITHAHADHIEGAFDLDKSYRIKRIVVAEGAQHDSRVVALARQLGVGVETMLAGDSFILGSERVEAVWPKVAVDDARANENCLVTRITEAGAQREEIPDVLITGDAEAQTIVQAEESDANRAAPVALKVGHHGSRPSLSPRLFEVVNVARAIISVGKNSYGHPKEETLERLKSEQIPFKRTDVSGTVYLPFAVGGMAQ